MTRQEPLSVKEVDCIWDCVVVGAGPAGSMAAREISKTGARVLLVERAAFPRQKVCGCCLNTRSVALLDRAGLKGLLPAAGAIPLERFRIAAGGRRADLPLPGGYALSRAAFDEALVDAASRSGVRFLPETQARLCNGDSANDYRELALRGDRGESVLKARIVIEATGLGGRLDPTSEAAFGVAAGSRTGAGTVVDATEKYRAGTIAMACGSSGYVGLVRVEGGLLDVAAAFDPGAIRAAGGMGPLAVRILADAGLPAIPGLESAAWKGTPLLTRKASRLTGHRHFRIGDAAGYVEPFTGEGMAWALASGIAVAPIASAGLREWSPAREREWADAYFKQVARRQLPCRLLAGALRWPAGTRAAVGLLQFLPGLARPVLRTLNRL